MPFNRLKSRTNRPQLKTGVWVLSDLFDTKKGGIDIPKRSKHNMPRYEEATKAQADLDDFCQKASKIINAGDEARISINREWIEQRLQDDWTCRGQPCLYALSRD